MKSVDSSSNNQVNFQEDYHEEQVSAEAAQQVGEPEVVDAATVELSTDGGKVALKEDTGDVSFERAFSEYSILVDDAGNLNIFSPGQDGTLIEVFPAALAQTALTDDTVETLSFLNANGDPVVFNYADPSHAANLVIASDPSSSSDMLGLLVYLGADENVEIAKAIIRHTNANETLIKDVLEVHPNNQVLQDLASTTVKGDAKPVVRNLRSGDNDRRLADSDTRTEVERLDDPDLKISDDDRALLQFYNQAFPDATVDGDAWTEGTKAQIIQHVLGHSADQLNLSETEIMTLSTQYPNLLIDGLLNAIEGATGNTDALSVEIFNTLFSGTVQEAQMRLAATGEPADQQTLVDRFNDSVEQYNQLRDNGASSAVLTQQYQAVSENYLSLYNNVLEGEAELPAQNVGLLRGAENVPLEVTQAMLEVAHRLLMPITTNFNISITPYVNDQGELNYFVEGQGMAGQYSVIADQIRRATGGGDGRSAMFDGVDGVTSADLNDNHVVGTVGPNGAIRGGAINELFLQENRNFREENIEVIAQLIDQMHQTPEGANFFWEHGILFPVNPSGPTEKLFSELKVAKKIREMTFDGDSRSAVLNFQNFIERHNNRPIDVVPGGTKSIDGRNLSPEDRMKENRPFIDDILKKVKFLRVRFPDGVNEQDAIDHFRDQAIRDGLVSPNPPPFVGALDDYMGEIYQAYVKTKTLPDNMVTAEEAAKILEYYDALNIQMKTGLHEILSLVNPRDTPSLALMDSAKNTESTQGGLPQSVATFIAQNTENINHSNQENLETLLFSLFDAPRVEGGDAYREVREQREGAINAYLRGLQGIVNDQLGLEPPVNFAIKPMEGKAIGLHNELSNHISISERFIRVLTAIDPQSQEFRGEIGQLTQKFIHECMHAQQRQLQSRLARGELRPKTVEYTIALMTATSAQLHFDPNISSQFSNYTRLSHEAMAYYSELKTREIFQRQFSQIKDDYAEYKTVDNNNSPQDEAVITENDDNPNDEDSVISYEYESEYSEETISDDDSYYEEVLDDATDQGGQDQRPIGEKPPGQGNDQDAQVDTQVEGIRSVLGQIQTQGDTDPDHQVPDDQVAYLLELTESLNPVQAANLTAAEKIDIYTLGAQLAAKVGDPDSPFARPMGEVVHGYLGLSGATQTPDQGFTPDIEIMLREHAEGIFTAISGDPQLATLLGDGTALAEMTGTERTEYLIVAMNRVAQLTADALALNEVPAVEYSDAVERGYYDPTRNTISVSPTLLTASPEDAFFLIDTIVHETTHAWQQALVTQFDAGGFMPGSAESDMATLLKASAALPQAAQDDVGYLQRWDEKSAFALGDTVLAQVLHYKNNQPGATVQYTTDYIDALPGDGQNFTDGTAVPPGYEQNQGALQLQVTKETYTDDALTELAATVVYLNGVPADSAVIDVDTGPLTDAEVTALKAEVYGQFAALYDSSAGDVPVDPAVPPDPAYGKRVLQAELNTMIDQLGEVNPEAQRALGQLMAIQTGLAGQALPYAQLSGTLADIREHLGSALASESVSGGAVADFVSAQLAQLPESAEAHLAALARAALAAAPDGTWDALDIDPANVDAQVQGFLNSETTTAEQKQALYDALSTSKVLSATPWLFEDARKETASTRAQTALTAVADTGAMPVLAAVVGRVAARLDGAINGLSPQELADESAINMMTYLAQENPTLLANMLEGTTRDALEAEFSEYLLGVADNPKLPLENRKGFFEYLRDAPAYLANTLSDAGKAAFQAAMTLAGSILEVIPFGPELKSGYALGQQYIQALRTRNAAANADSVSYGYTDKPLTVADFEGLPVNFDPDATHSVGSPPTDKKWGDMTNTEKRTLAQRLGGNQKENVGNQFDPNRDQPISGTVDIGPGQYTKIEAYLQSGVGASAAYGNLTEAGYEIRLDAEYGLVAYFRAEGGMEHGNTFKVALTAGVSNAASVSFSIDQESDVIDASVGVFGNAQAGPSAAFIGEAFVGVGGVGFEGVVGYTLAEIEFGGKVELGAAGLSAHGELNTGFGFGLGTTADYDQDTGVLTMELNLELIIFFGIEVGFEVTVDINKIRGIDPPEARFLAASFYKQTAGSGKDTFDVPSLSPPGDDKFQVFYVDGQGGDDTLVLPGYSNDWAKEPVTDDPHGAQFAYRNTITGDRIYTIDVEEIRYTQYSFQYLEPSVQGKADEYATNNPDRFIEHDNVFDAMIDYFDQYGSQPIHNLAYKFGEGGASGVVFNPDGAPLTDDNFAGPDFHDFISNYLGANVESVLTQFDSNQDGLFSSEDATLFVEHLKAVGEMRTLLSNFDDPTSAEAQFAEQLSALYPDITPETVQQQAVKMAVADNAPENVMAIRDAVLAGEMASAEALTLLAGQVPLAWVEAQSLNPLATQQYYAALMDALVLNGRQTPPDFSEASLFGKAREIMGEAVFAFGSLTTDYAAHLAERRDGLTSGNPTPTTDALDQPLDKWLPFTEAQKQEWRALLVAGGMMASVNDAFPSMQNYLGLNDEQVKTLGHFEANGHDVKGLILKTLSMDALTPAKLKHSIDTVMQLMVTNGEDNTDDILFSFLETGNANNLVTQSRAALHEQRLTEAMIKGGVQGIEGGPDFQTRIDALAQSKPAEYERFILYAQAYYDVKLMLEGPDAKFTEADIDLILHDLKDGDGHDIGGLDWSAIHEAMVAYGGGAPGSLTQNSETMTSFVNDLVSALPDTTYSDFASGAYQRDYEGLAWQALSANINDGQPFSHDGGDNIDRLLAHYTYDGPPFYESTALMLSTGVSFGPVDFIKGAFEVFNFGDNRQGLNAEEFGNLLGSIGRAKDNITKAQADGLGTIVEESRAEKLARARNEAFMDDLSEAFFEQLFDYNWRGDDIYTWRNMSDALGIGDMSQSTQKRLREAFDVRAQSEDKDSWDFNGIVADDNIGGKGVNEAQYRDFVQDVLALRADAFTATGYDPHEGVDLERINGDYKYSNAAWQGMLQQQVADTARSWVNTIAGNSFLHHLNNWTYHDNKEPTWDNIEQYFNFDSWSRQDIVEDIKGIFDQYSIGTDKYLRTSDVTKFKQDIRALIDEKEAIAGHHNSHQQNGDKPPGSESKDDSLDWFW